MDGPGLAALAVGSVFVYAGVKGYSVPQAITNVIQGDNPNANQTDAALQSTTPTTGNGNGGGKGPPPGPGGHNSNVALGRIMAAPYGWATGEEWADLDALWERESGWETTAANPSGAYGIPQALPGSKMASAGPDWQTNPKTQIKWGLGYIKERYGDPIQAWAHEEANGWY